MWDTINGAWIELQEVGAKALRRGKKLAKFLRFVQGDLAAVRRSAYRTMLRNDAYWFSRLGLHRSAPTTPRAFSTSKYHVLLPEEHVGGPLDYYQWTSILRSVSALTAYHWVYRETLNPG